MNYKTIINKGAAVSLAAASLAGISGAQAEYFYSAKPVASQLGTDLNSGDNTVIQPGNCAVGTDGALTCEDPAASGGGRDQSQQFSDILLGTYRDDVQIGGLGSDVLLGKHGDDVQIGGLEHFFPHNRDQAHGDEGNDIFIWKPGDGSDYFSGGPGTDVVIFGNIGEGSTEPSFGVVADRQRGEVFLDPKDGLPRVDVTGSGGFCEVIDGYYADDAAELEALDLDHLVRFSIRGVADAFEAGDQQEDNGLRVTLSLDEVEFVVCTARAGGQVEVFDLRVSPPAVSKLDDPSSIDLDNLPRNTPQALLDLAAERKLAERLLTIVR